MQWKRQRLIGGALVCLCSFGTTLLLFRESSFQIVGISHVIAQRKCHEHDVFRKDEADSFGGSSSVFETNSTLSLGHVCLQRNESTGVYLYTYSPYKEPPILANGTPPFAGEIGKKSNEWTNDSHYYYVPNTTVLIVRIYGENIAHCMSDIIFSIAPAIPQLWNATSTPKTFLHVEKSDNQVRRLLYVCGRFRCIPSFLSYTQQYTSLIIRGYGILATLGVATPIGTLALLPRMPRLCSTTIYSGVEFQYVLNDSLFLALESTEGLLR
jgi:hypothetical protein